MKKTLYKVGIVSNEIPKILWKQTFDTGFETDGIYDFDNDGEIEIFAHSRTYLELMSLKDGKTKWKKIFENEEIKSVKLDDFDYNGEIEALVISKSNDFWNIRLIDHEGNSRFAFSYGEAPFLEYIQKGSLRNLPVIMIPFSSKVVVIVLDYGKIIAWQFSFAENPIDIKILLGDFDSNAENELLILLRYPSRFEIYLLDPIMDSVKWVLKIPSKNSSESIKTEILMVNRRKVLLALVNRKYRVIDLRFGEVIAEIRSLTENTFIRVGNFFSKDYEQILICESYFGEREFSRLTFIDIRRAKFSEFFFDFAPFDCLYADLNGDYIDEIILLTEKSIRILQGSSIIWHFQNPLDSEFISATLKDFDNDDEPEIMVTADFGAIIIDAKNQSVCWIDEDISISDPKNGETLGIFWYYDINNDDIDEVILLDEGKIKIVVLEGDSGKVNELWSLDLGDGEIFDIEFIPSAQLIVLSTDKGLYGLTYDGEISWICKECKAMIIETVDINSDGTEEIIVWDEDLGIYLLDLDGKILWSRKEKNFGLYLGDVNGDFVDEIIALTEQSITILDGNQNIIASYDIGRLPVTVDLDDYDEDGVEEIVILSSSKMVFIDELNIRWERDLINISDLYKVSIGKTVNPYRKDILLVCEDRLMLLNGLTGSVILNELYTDINPKLVEVDDINGDATDEIIVYSNGALYIFQKNLLLKLWKLTMKSIKNMLIVNWGDNSKNIALINDKLIRILNPISGKIIKKIKIPGRDLLLEALTIDFDGDGSDEIALIFGSHKLISRILLIKPKTGMVLANYDVYMKRADFYKHGFFVKRIRYANNHTMSLLINGKNSFAIISHNQPLKIIKGFSLKVIGDFNADGNLEGIVGRGSKFFIYYFKDDRILPLKKEADRYLSGSTILFSEDIDGDGINEVAIYSGDNYLKFLDFFSGNGVLEVQRYVIKNPLDILLADLDHDDAKELIILTSDGLSILKPDVEILEMKLDEQIQLLGIPLQIAKLIKKLQEEIGLKKSKTNIIKYQIKNGDSKIIVWIKS